MKSDTRALVCFREAMLCCLLWALAEAPASETSSGGPTQAVALEYAELPYSLWDQFVPQAPLEGAWKKTPDFQKRKVSSFRLQLSANTNLFLPVAWDEDDGRLYLDLNRNLDLTDDSDGMFTARESGRFKLFSGVRLKLDTPAGTHPFLFDIEVRRWNPTSLFVQMKLRSFWEGKAAIGGRDWQVGIIENFLARTPADQTKYFLIRPWDARTNSITLVQGTPDAIDLAPRLFAGGQACQLSWRYIASKPGYELQLAEQQPALGELAVTGEMLDRLILVGEYTAVLDQPRGTVKLPVGSYRLIETWLRTGASTAVSNAGRDVAVKREGAVNLKIGGPLSNSVSASRQGSQLNLAHTIVGIDGSPYRFPVQVQENPPEFTIFLGAKKVAADRFSYG